MNTEELRILLRTIADTAGARQTQQALNAVQQSGRAASGATANVGTGFASATRSVAGFAGAIGLAYTGAQLAQEAIQRTIQTVQDAADAFVYSARVTRAAAAAYGQMAGDWIRFADGMSASTGQSRNAILEAALSARTLSANYGLATAQTQRLIQVSANLANIRGIGIAEAFERVQSAIRGEAEASEYLGLTLNDTFIKNNALNGSVRNTFETMTDAQKAQIRYGEVLRQSAAFEGLAEQSAQGLEGAQRSAALASEEFSRTLGTALAPALESATRGQQALTEAASEFIKTASQGTSEERRARDAARLRSEIGQNLQQIGIIQNQWGLLFDASSGSLLHLEDLADRLQVSWDDLAGVMETSQDKFTGSAQGLDLVRGAIARMQAPAAALKTTLGDISGIVPAAALRTADEIIRRLATDMETFAQRSQELGAVLQALPIGDVLLRAGIQAQQSMQQIDQAVTARLAAAEKLRRARELEQTASRVSDPRDSAGAAVASARLAQFDQIEAAQRDLLIAQQGQRDIQRETLELTAREAAVRLQMLPLQQRMAELQRDVAESQARGRLAALPASEALQDLRYQQERARLISSNRNLSVEERTAARRSLRDLGRQEPGVALGALEAERRQVPAQRAAERAGLENQLAEIANQRILAPLEREQQRLQLLGQIADSIVQQREQRLEVIIQHAIDVNVNGAAAANLTPENAEAIANQARDQVLQAVHAARLEAERAAGQRLALGGRS